MRSYRLNKIQQYQYYNQHKDFFDEYMRLGEKLISVREEILNSLDTEQTVIDSLKTVQSSLTLVANNRDIIIGSFLGDIKEIEKTLYDLENALIDLLEDE